MTFTLFKIKIYISYFFVSGLTLLLFLKQANGVFYCIFFSLLHEIGHIIAIILCKVKITSLRFEAFGICISCDELGSLSLFKKILVLSGGALVNLAFVMLSQSTMINLCLVIFNMLPIGWLDGGRILYEILCTCFKENKADIIHSVISFILLTPITAMSLYFVNKNPTLLLVCLYLCITVLLKKKRMLKCY